jgi:hypothetical protein
MQSCYRKYLHSHANAGGKVEIHFVIDAKGKVIQTSVAGFATEISRCVQENIARVVFDRPRDGNNVYVDQTITFRPRYSYRLPKDTKREILGANSEELQARSKRICMRRPRPAVKDVELELATCYRRALKNNPRAGGRMLALMHLHADGTIGNVSGLGLPDRELAKCAADVLRTIPNRVGPEGGTIACTVVFHNPRMSAVMSEITSLSVTRGDINLQSKTVGDTFDFDRVRPLIKASDNLLSELQLRRFAFSHRTSYRGVPLPRRDHLAVHAHPAVTMRAVENVLDSVWQAQYNSIHYSRAIGASTTFMAVNPLGTPDWRCQGARAPVSMVVTPKEIRVRTAKQTIRLARKGKRFDYDALRGKLELLRKTHDSDIDIAAVPDVQYRVLLNALEHAVKAGFFDARYVPMARLAYR